VEASTPKRGISAALGAIAFRKKSRSVARLWQQNAARLMFPTSRFRMIASTPNRTGSPSGPGCGKSDARANDVSPPITSVPFLRRQ
jgi:hypothetical protein